MAKTKAKHKTKQQDKDMCKKMIRVMSAKPTFPPLWSPRDTWSKGWQKWRKKKPHQIFRSQKCHQRHPRAWTLGNGVLWSLLFSSTTTFAFLLQVVDSVCCLFTRIEECNFSDSLSLTLTPVPNHDSTTILFRRIEESKFSDCVYWTFIMPKPPPHPPNHDSTPIR